MQFTVLCPGCDQRLSEVAKAMRRHAKAMNTAIQLDRSGGSETKRKDWKERLAASFNDAQSAWDTYREHLDEHGLLPNLHSTRDVA